MARTKYRIKKAKVGYEVTTISETRTRKIYRSTFWAACKEVWTQQGLLRP